MSVNAASSIMHHPPAIDQHEMKVLEQARKDLTTLTQSLSTLQGTLPQSDPLPPWDSFRTHLSIISQNLDTLMYNMTEEQTKPILDHLAVFPLAGFPGREHEGLLGQLVRKKLEPNVEDWVTEGREAGKSGQALVSADNQDDLCEFAGEFVTHQAQRRAWASNFTLEEHEMGVQNVNTGLRRKLPDNAIPKKPKKSKNRDSGQESNDETSNDEEEGSEMETSGEEGEDGEEDAGDEMELVDIHRRRSGVGVEFDIRQDKEGKVANLQEKPPMALTEQLKFMTTGILPRG